MSRFITHLPVDQDAVLKLLPKAAHVESVTWNKKASRVEVVWDHQPFNTGLQYPVEFSVEQLGKKECPEGVEFKGRKKTTEAPQNETSNSKLQTSGKLQASSVNEEPVGLPSDTLITEESLKRAEAAKVVLKPVPAKPKKPEPQKPARKPAARK